jgi:hypothetical protein
MTALWKLSDMQAGDSKNPVGVAFVQVHRTIDDSRLARAERCEICGRTEAEVFADIEQRRGRASRRNHVIQANHWRGYEYRNALDIWWICTSCNGMLWGHHDGSLTLDAARAMWRRKQGAASIALAGGRVLRLRDDHQDAASASNTSSPITERIA